MRAMKMTTRAIAAATGASQRTVVRELSGESFDSPAPDDDVIDAELVDDEEKRVIGLDRSQDQGPTGARHSFSPQRNNGR